MSEQLRDGDNLSNNPRQSEDFSYVSLVILLFGIIFLVLWLAMGKAEERKKLKTAFGWVCVITFSLLMFWLLILLIANNLD